MYTTVAAAPKPTPLGSPTLTASIAVETIRVDMSTDMETDIKTTIELSDALLAKVRKVALREGVTVHALIALGLRRALSQRAQSEPFCLRKATFKGRGLGVFDTLGAGGIARRIGGALGAATQPAAGRKNPRAESA